MKINQKIKGYSVVNPGDTTKLVPAAEAPPSAPAMPMAEIIQMHEKVERPETLIGETYKIKSPLFEHSLYVTINDIVLNVGTEHEMRRPFEIFINSKNMEHFQWIVALTRIMSAVFRKGGDVTFLVEELKAVFDPRGGYFKAGGVYMHSIVAELGHVIEAHLKMIGLLHDPEMSPEQRNLIAEKRAIYDSRSKKNSGVNADLAGAAAQTARKSDAAAVVGAAEAAMPSADSSFPPGATMCGKCSTSAVILMDGCATCLNCGYSKCG
ncbi:MAG: NrdJb [Dokdonella sp.]